MNSKVFGTLVAGVLASSLVGGAAFGKDAKHAGKKAAAGKAAAAGQCAHACKGHGKCSGNGNANGCGGKNSCAGQGQVPEECAAAKDTKACGEVKGEDGKAMCKWKA